MTAGVDRLRATTCILPDNPAEPLPETNENRQAMPAVPMAGIFRSRKMIRFRITPAAMITDE